MNKSICIKYLLPVIFLVIQHSNSIAQKQDIIDDHMSVSKMEHRAKNALKFGDAYTALFYYEKVVEKDKNNIDALYQLAGLYNNTRNYKKALVAYDSVFSKKPNHYPMALYHKGLMEKRVGHYKKAKETLTQVKRNTRKIRDRDFKRLLIKQLYGCDSAMNFIDFPENTKIENAGSSINHPHLEFSPLSIDSNTLLFGSLRADSLRYFDISNEYSNQPTRQLYKASLIDSIWVEQGFFEELNDTTMEMGNFVYAPKAKRYYFTKCKKNHKGQPSCKIYYAQKKGKSFEAPVLMDEPINLKHFTSTQPAIFYNKKYKKEYLYFVSNRPGGKGGMDLWFTYYHKKKKLWIEPRNLGFNTPGTECTPYFDPRNGTLYFSSDGKAGMGGLDIYMSKRGNRKFTRPVNMRYPINSPQDDLDFSLAQDSLHGFLVSNRIGGTPYLHETCCDDIFQFEVLPPKPFNCTLDLLVNSQETTGCDSATLEIVEIDLKTKKESTKTIMLEDCNIDFMLEKNKQYSFILKKDGFENDTLELATKSASSKDSIKKELSLKLKLKPVLPTEKPTLENPFVLEDIRYETNKAELTKAAKNALDSILIPYLKKHPNDTVLIISHTDNAGSKKYNLKLSESRAANVANYLVKKGISKLKLQSKGYGENMPIAPNENPDGSINEIGRSLNRRTEFSFL